MLDEVKALASVMKSRHLHIDSIVFRLHCRLTTITLCVALFIVCTTQFVTSPIYCDSQQIEVSKDLLDTFCYMHSMFRVVSIAYLDTPQIRVALERAKDFRSGTEIVEPFPGIRPLGSSSATHRVVQYTYYQWIWVIYLIQAIAFYSPNWLWKQLEGNRMKSLVSKIDFFESKKNKSVFAEQSNGGYSDTSATDRSADKSNLQLFALYIDHSFGSNRFYMNSYFACEILAIVNIIAQMVTLNWMLHGRWLAYGLDVLKLYLMLDKVQNPRQLLAEDGNPMTLLFPKQTKCDYRRFGPSGNRENIDALCMLPLNNFNDKFFLILWAWMYALLALFGALFVYRLAQFTMLPLRVRAIKTRVTYEPDTKSIFKGSLSRLIAEIDIADWFVLNNVGRNLDSQNYYEALAELIKLRRMRAEKMETITIETMNVEDGDAVNDNRRKDSMMKRSSSTSSATFFGAQNDHDAPCVIACNV